MIVTSVPTVPLAVSDGAAGTAWLVPGMTTYSVLATPEFGVGRPSAEENLRVTSLFVQPLSWSAPAGVMV